MAIPSGNNSNMFSRKSQGLKREVNMDNKYRQYYQKVHKIMQN